MKTVHDIIIKPLISERSLKEAVTGHYSFVVAKEADKQQIKDAVGMLFNVDVKKVYTNIVRKNRIRVTRFGKRSEDNTYKKARVTLGKDQKINIFEEVKK